MTAPSESSFDAMLREAAELRVPGPGTAKPPELGELLESKYRIEEPLGAGGMGAVYRATNVENGKAVAIKWLLSGSATACARFSREAHVAAQIDHPNVVNVFDLGSHRGGPYLVMELLRGESLGARVRAGRLQPLELVEIMIRVLRGVRAAHDAGVIHRDLKPDNVFLSVGPDGAAREPKVLDFGISKLRAKPSSAFDPTASAYDERLTGEGTGLGTLAYMSPEQLVDAPNVDERTDIYAAGVMMYEALVGRLPFQADNHNALVLAIAAQRPLPMRVVLPSIAPALESIVMRAMAKDPSDRHPHAQALIDDLEAWLAESASAELHERGAKKRRSVRARWLTPVIFLVLCVFSLWLSQRPANAPSAAVGASPGAHGASERTSARSTRVQADVVREPTTRPDEASLPATSAANGVASPAPSGTLTLRRDAPSQVRAVSRAGALRRSDL